MTRIPSLDGLRGLAILLVVLCHLELPLFWFGGPVGVTLFLVLSGYLITGILTRQVDAGGVRFAEFYLRRARRLLPALIVVVAAGVLLLRDVDWWTFSWPALTYTSSFIASSDTPNLGYLVHTWSLAVEEHFYLLWPAAIAIIPARHRVKAIAVLVGLTAAWRVVLWMTEPFERLYYSTDGNAAALLLGCLLAVIAHRLPAPNRRYGIYAIAGLLTLSILPDVPGKGLLTFLTIILAAVAVHSAPAIKTLEVGWLGWFGTISYGLYLWHPILFKMSESLWMVPVSVLVAWLSWRFVEKPILEWKRPRLIVAIPVPVPAI